ncbi:MAG: hypothetical protein LBE78_06740 [Burkholderiaceae bacterium]|nr:hypothetical protein [Burkholderiaceae bacterium]
MNTPNIAITSKLNAWDRSIPILSDLITDSLQAEPSTATHKHMLWWGVGYSEILAKCVQAGVAYEISLAESDPRFLQRGKALMGNQAPSVRLLSIDDLRRDALGLKSALSGLSLRDVDSYLAFSDKLSQHFDSLPAFDDEWAQCIVMDFTLNRVPPSAQSGMLSEAFRVLHRQGRFLCAVLVSDTALPSASVIKGSPIRQPLWIPTEENLLNAIEQAGFHGASLRWPIESTENPEFIDRIGDADIRMCVIEGYKGKHGSCFELGQAVIYNGPWKEVHDDDGHIYRRGQRVAVCSKTYDLLMRAPYRGALTGLRSVNEPPLEQAALFDCNTPALRDPRVTKGFIPFTGAQPPAAALCAPGSGCC